jgi:NADP-dependent aldehyde dehydrogenase
MLHEGIAKNYQEKSLLILSQTDVSCITSGAQDASNSSPEPILTEVSGVVFLNNPLLQEEVFGPFSMLVRCKDQDEMAAVARSLAGQLTSTLMATDNDFSANASIADIIASKCGRIILNGVPTGVEVCQAMHHGGPFPASTDSRFTSVGADAIKRFARPLAFQNFPDAILPDELKNANPLGITRSVNDIPTSHSL